MNFITRFKKTNNDNPNFSEGKYAFLNGNDLSDNPYHSDTDSFSQWESGWEEAKKNRQNISEKEEIGGGERYLIGGLVTGTIVFISCWIYAVMSWGFLLGLGLGWIPSFFIAIIAGFLWPLIALIILVGACILAYLFYKVW